MRFAFESLPGSPVDTPRPAITLAADGPFGRANLLALVDTGALFNRFGRWIADEIGIDLAGLPVERIGLGGFSLESVTATVRLTVGDFSWEAPVGFCDPWPFAFHIVGQEGFFRWFTVTIDAADETLTVEPNDR